MNGKKILSYKFNWIVIMIVMISFFISVDLSNASEDSPLAKTYQEHGGLEKWQEQNSMTYTMIGFPLSPQVAKPNKSNVDLRNRYNRIEGEGFTVGFNGEIAWSVPGPEAVGLKPRFFSLGSFYFVGMPFVFADEGVVLIDAGEANFQGKTYRLVKVGYKTGTGYTSKDDFNLLIDRETNKLSVINHSVTELPDVERVTWVFDEWQDVNGILIPSKLTFYPGWNPDDPGKGSTYTIENVKFSNVVPDKSIYEAPDNAVIDTSPLIH